MQLNYLYDNGLISQVMPAMQRKLHAVMNLGVPQIVNVMAAIILRLSFLLMKQQDTALNIAINETIAGIEEPGDRAAVVNGMFVSYS